MIHKNMLKYLIMLTVFTVIMVAFLAIFSKQLTPMFDFLDTTLLGSQDVSAYNPYGGGDAFKTS
jgi:hypothetical protein